MEGEGGGGWRGAGGMQENPFGSLLKPASLYCLYRYVMVIVEMKHRSMR